MPMRSQAQRAYLHLHHPEVAKKFEAETPKGKTLPKHVDHDEMDMKRKAYQTLMKG